MSLIEWTVVLHVGGVFLWIGGLLTLTRLHVEAGRRQGTANGLSGLAESVFESLIHPALMLVLVTGILLVFLKPALLGERWLHLKVALVVGLIGMDVRAFRVIIDVSGSGSAGGSRRHFPLQAGMVVSVLGVLILTFARSC